MKALWGVALLAVLVSSSGCGYALAGRGSFLPDYIRTIGIPNMTIRLKALLRGSME